MWLPKEERHFAATLLIAAVGGIVGAIGLLSLLSPWTATEAALLTALTVLLSWWVCKRRGTVQYTDESRAGELPSTILLAVVGGPLAVISVGLLRAAVAGVSSDSDLGRGLGFLALFLGTGLAAPSVLLFYCAWRRRPTRKR